MNLRSLARLTLQRLGLMGMVRRARAGDVIKPADVINRESVESLVAGADDYYRSAIDKGATAFLKSKPFHSFQESPQVLVRLGWLLHGAKLTTGLHVAEYGGGSGWLAASLWQMGCHVTCIDASAAALELARELSHERRPLLTWPHATFSTALTDGRTLPLADASMDRVICFDVFHHVPNQAEVLREFFRVLRPGGIACFSEPGPYHSAMTASQEEMANHQVLENDIVVEDIWNLARAAGFSDIGVQPMLDASYALSFDEYRRMRRGFAGLAGTDALVNGTEALSVFFLHKGAFVLDSRYPSALSASITASRALKVSCTNTGQGRWLSKSPDGTDVGVVRVGLMRCDENGTVVERDWIRVPLPHDVEPGETVEIAYELPIPNPESLITRVDLVAEHVKWFGATTGPIAVRVSA